MADEKSIVKMNKMIHKKTGASFLVVYVVYVTVHSLSSGKVEMFLCAACHAFTPHVNAWKH